MSTSNYQKDFYAWTQEQADLLRSARFAELDLGHLIEELESMGASERRQLVSQLKILLAHLLKWQFQSHLRSRSWEATIKEQRLSLLDLLDENPSLKAIIDEQIAKAYRLARLLAVKETNFEEQCFPLDCPYSWQQIQDERFYPA